MGKKLVLVGGSPFSLLLSCELEKHLGGLSHLELVFVTNGETVVYPHQATLFGKIDSITIAEALPSTRVVIAAVKSVNLRLKEVITDGAVINYDYLILDQTPYYLEENFKELRESLSTLFAQLSSQEKLGEMPSGMIIEVGGDSYNAAQLALAIKRDTLSHRRKSITVAYTGKNNQTVRDFMNRSGVATKLSSSQKQMPKLVIQPPRPVVLPSKVRGAKLAKDGQIMVSEHLHILNDKHTFVIPSWLGETTNLLSSIGLITKKYAAQIQMWLENTNHKELPETDSSYYLIGVKESLLKIKKWQSERIRAGLAARLEKLIWNRIKARNG